MPEIGLKRHAIYAVARVEAIVDEAMGKDGMVRKSGHDFAMKPMLK
jgi:hypothetical protein